jgi:hypothetical protein
VKSIGGPAEVFVPRVLTRIEEADDFACLRVGGLLEIAAAFVAVAARQSKVFRFVATSVALRNYVIHCESYELPPLVGVAVLAPASRTV